MKTIILSLGHNRGRNYVKGTMGWIKSKYEDKGASGNGTTEFDVTKAIIDEVVRIGIPGVNIVKVPELLNLEERIKWVNGQFAKYPEPLAMEFHLDSASALAKGASVWYNDTNQYTMGEGKKFLAKYTEVTGLTSRHVNSDKTNRLGDLGFVSEIKCASLLVELGFISNKDELWAIRSKGVDAVIKSIVALKS